MAVHPALKADNKGGSNNFQSGDFDYFDCWEHGFISPGTNDEKAMTALTLKAFATSLAQQDFLFGDNKPPIDLVEAGIGDGSSTRRFIEALKDVHKAGFVIHGSDPQGQWLSNANVTLRAIQGVKTKIASLKKADAFKGDQLSDSRGQLFLGSHFLYFAKHRHDAESDPQVKDTKINNDIHTFMCSVMNSLDKNGMAILYHDGEGSDIYGKDGIGGQFGNSMTDAPQRIAAIASQMGLNLVSVKVPSRQFFPPLDEQTIESFKDLKNWDKYTPGSKEAMWLKKFLFALDELAIFAADGQVISLGGANALEARGTLAKAVQATKDMLDKNGGYMPMLAQMQIIYENRELSTVIETAARAVEAQMPDIQQEADRIMKAEALAHQR